MKVLRSDSMVIAENLAVEEGLLEHGAAMGPTLFLWQSERTVVIGRHQNPWLECNLANIHRDGGVLARRLSGGGTVYHDRGNLNLSLLLNRDRYQREDPYAILIKALHGLGIPADILGRSSIGVDGLKCSGHAFCYRKNRVLHHATLLWDADVSTLHKWLGVPPRDIETHAVASEPAEVINLKSLQSTLEVEAVWSAVEDACRDHYGGARDIVDLEELHDSEFGARCERYRSWEWTYGRTPAFRFTSGTTGQRVNIRGGEVEQVEGKGSIRVGLPMADDWL